MNVEKGLFGLKFFLIESVLEILKSSEPFYKTPKRKKQNKLLLKSAAFKSNRFLLTWKYFLNWNIIITNQGAIILKSIIGSS